MAIPPLLPFMIIGGILAFSGPKKAKRDWRDPKWRMPPSNLSGDTEGYNTSAFTSPFSIKLAFTFLGYGVGLFDATPEGVAEIVNPAIVKEFQRDYNAISSMGMDGQSINGVVVPGILGHLNVDGDIGVDTLNALEHAINWVRIAAVGGLWQKASYEARAKAYD